MSERRVLVTGGTGTVGSAVVDSLAERGDVAVRAGTRDPAAARERFVSDPSFNDDVEFVRFDFEKPETWSRAFEGVSGLFLVLPPRGSADRVLDAAAAAVRVGVSRLVYLSVLGVERNPVVPHWRIERGLRGLDAAYTFLRASFFMQNFAEVHRRDIAERNEVFVPAGNGETSFVDARDVGEVGAKALTEAGHANRAYDVTGPAALDYDEVAGVFADVLGRPISYPNPSLLRFVRRAYARGRSLPFVLVMAGIYTTARLGLAGRVSDDARRVLGRPPRSLRTFVTDYRERFEPPDSSATDADPRSKVSGDR
jgi:uncharacterized protein YbjT (DUF2867 family)